MLGELAKGAGFLSLGWIWSGVLFQGRPRPPGPLVCPATPEPVPVSFLALPRVAVCQVAGHGLRDNLGAGLAV